MNHYAIIRVKKEKDNSVTILRNPDDNLDVVKIISDDKHKVVPREPTEEMKHIEIEGLSYGLSDVYKAMIKAAPDIEDL